MKKKKEKILFCLGRWSLSLSLLYPHLVSQRFGAANAIASSCKVFFRTEGCINKARYKSVYFTGTFALSFCFITRDKEFLPFSATAEFTV